MIRLTLKLLKTKDDAMQRKIQVSGLITNHKVEENLFPPEFIATKIVRWDCPKKVLPIRT